MRLRRDGVRATTAAECGRGSSHEALGLAQYAHWVYVLRNQHLAQAPIDAAIARAVSTRILVGPAAWVLAIVLALFSPVLGYDVYFVVLIGYLVSSVGERTAIR